MKLIVLVGAVLGNGRGDRLDPPGDLFFEIRDLTAPCRESGLRTILQLAQRRCGGRGEPVRFTSWRGFVFHARLGWRNPRYTHANHARFRLPKLGRAHGEPAANTEDIPNDI
jgi:hypothetical protein